MKKTVVIQSLIGLAFIVASGVVPYGFVGLMSPPGFAETLPVDRQLADDHVFANQAPALTKPLQEIKNPNTKGLQDSSKAIAKPLRMNVSEETLVLTDDVSVAEAQADRYPDNPEAYFLLAVAYSRTPYFEKAFAAAKKAKALLKQNPEGYAGFDRRLTEYEAMQAHDPQNAKILYRLGFAYFMKGYVLDKHYVKDSAEQAAPYYAKAETVMRQVIALDPNDTWARNYLGYLLVDANPTENTDKAMRLWQESIALNPSPSSNPGAYFLLGEAYLKKGDLRKALQYGSKGLATREP